MKNAGNESPGIYFCFLTERFYSLNTVIMYALPTFPLLVIV